MGSREMRRTTRGVGEKELVEERSAERGRDVGQGRDGRVFTAARCAAPDGHRHEPSAEVACSVRRHYYLTPLAGAQAQGLRATYSLRVRSPIWQQRRPSR